MLLQKKKVSDAIGFGVFATRTFDQGEPILPYKGDLITTRREYDSRVNIYRTVSKCGSYVFQFTNFKEKTHWFVNY